MYALQCRVRFCSFFIILITCVLLNAFGGTPDFRFMHIGQDDGLSQNSANCIIQDSRGYIWVATFDGLNRFDGEEFKVYRNDPFDPESLIDSGVTWLAPAANGSIWIATREGLDHFNPQTKEFTHFTHDPDNPHSLSDNFIYFVMVDSQETLWIATDKGGLNQLNVGSTQFIHYTHTPENPHSLDSNLIYSVYEDSQGMIWVGTDMGVQSLNKSTGEVKRYPHPDEAFGEIYCIFEDSRQRLWVTSYGGGLAQLHRYNDSFTTYTTEDTPAGSGGLRSNNVQYINEDDTGRLWVATDGAGIAEFQPEQGKFTHYLHDTSSAGSLAHNNVVYIFKDN